MQSLLKISRSGRLPGAGECQGGFSLLEAILAIGILSIVCIQIINVQSASMEIVAVSRSNQLATWAMRSANAQLQYVLDVYGVEGLRPSTEFKAGPEKDLTVTVETAQTTIEASRLFMTAMRMTSVLGGAGAPESEEERNEQEAQYKEIGDALDSQVPKDIYRTIKVKVTWNLAGVERSMDGGFLVVDDKGLTLGGGLEALTGVGGGGALPDDSGSNGSDSGGGQDGEEPNGDGNRSGGPGGARRSPDRGGGARSDRNSGNPGNSPIGGQDE